MAERCKVAGLVRNKARDVRADDDDGDGNADDDKDERKKREGFTIEGKPQRRRATNG